MPGLAVVLDARGVDRYREPHRLRLGAHQRDPRELRRLGRARALARVAARERATVDLDLAQHLLDARRRWPGLGLLGSDRQHVQASRAALGSEDEPRAAPAPFDLRVAGSLDEAPPERARRRLAEDVTVAQLFIALGAVAQGAQALLGGGAVNVAQSAMKQVGVHVGYERAVELQ